jgi:intracellular sulfur oxidation DsrE/DsrF family protein
MLIHRGLPVLAAWILCAVPGHAAEPARSTGPVFDRFGPVFDNVEADYMPPVETYRAMFDVYLGPQEKDQLNPRLETLARFMNYNARAGVEVKNMHLAVVLHGSAGKAVLTNDAYRKRFGVENPDRELLAALTSHGVRVLMCGQSAAYRGYARAEMIDEVEVAMSAYTAILGLQEEGYRKMPTWD